jgi:uncharacterized protein
MLIESASRRWHAAEVEVPMAKVFIASTNGSENPTKATLALLFAKAAVEEGHEVKVALIGDAAVNIRDTVADNILGMGLPPYKELMAFLVSKKVNFFV